MTPYIPRPMRNKNPGDLRTLPGNQKWHGQIMVDTAPGGPFAIFGTEEDGWGALATCLLAYQTIHNLRTVRGIITRYAPQMQNDTYGYISAVSKSIGVSPDATIDLHNISTMLPLVTVIARVEGGSGLQWDAAARLAGVTAALTRAASE